MERCPCCKARLGSASVCPRCLADLSKVIGAEKSAQFWLSQALLYWQENEMEQSVSALQLSLCLDKTTLALVMRDFLVQQQCLAVLDLLAQNQLLPAKQRLYSVRRLFPHFKLLQELHSFTDYLWAKHQDMPTPYSAIKPAAVNENAGGLLDLSEADYG